MDKKNNFIDDLLGSVRSFESEGSMRREGRVISSGDGIVNVDGLLECKYGELLEFENDVYGIAMIMDKEKVGAVLLASDANVNVNSRVLGTEKLVEVPVGRAVLGRVIDPLGQPLDGKGRIISKHFRPIEVSAPKIIDRDRVTQSLQTGLMGIDAMIPIGKGQRELIIGDKQTGKTAIALDTILNQKGKDVICVYVSIGQKASTTARLISILEDNDAMEYCVVVAATASDSAPVQYIAPYAGCSIAEDFMLGGRDVLIVYDDLSKHAVAYRAMSLLLGRPSGREAYPGDVFYLHSRLLERAAKLSVAKGGGSMTALPIIETMAGDISAYIPTNVISITDGQIFLESELFYSGIRPAINVGLSVSRVGGAAQNKAMRKVSGSLRLELAQYREMAIFAQFASDLDKTTRQLLSKGARLTEMLKQAQYQPMSISHQVVLLYVVTNSLLMDVPIDMIKQFKVQFIEYINLHHVNILNLIDETGDLTDESIATLKSATELFLKDFLPDEE